MRGNPLSLSCVLIIGYFLYGQSGCIYVLAKRHCATGILKHLNSNNGIG